MGYCINSVNGRERGELLVKITIDSSGWNTYFNRLRRRIRGCRDNLFNDAQASVLLDVSKLLDTAAGKSERITLTKQIEHFEENRAGVYGRDFGVVATSAKKVNPQEQIDPNKPLGTGRMIKNKFVVYRKVSDGLFQIDLGTTAMMQPYAMELPMKPLAYYLREGWKGKGKHMVKRPFGNWMAETAKEEWLISKYHTKILRGVGFKEG